MYDTQMRVNTTTKNDVRGWKSSSSECIVGVSLWKLHAILQYTVFQWTVNRTSNRTWCFDDHSSSQSMPAPGLLAKSLSMSSYSFIIYLMTRSNESVRNHSADIIAPPPHPTTVNPSPQSHNIYGIFKLIAVALWNRELAEGGNFTSFLAINSFFFLYAVVTSRLFTFSSQCLSLLIYPSVTVGLWGILRGSALRLLYRQCVDLKHSVIPDLGQVCLSAFASIYVVRRGH